MLLDEWISRLGRAERELATLRWGVHATTPRAIGEVLRSSRGAAKLTRRIADAGAIGLFRLLIEHGGGPVRGLGDCVWERAELAHFYVMRDTPEGPAIPVDLAAAAARGMGVERFFLVPMLARLDGGAWRSLAEELGLRSTRSRPVQVASAAQRILGAPHMEDDALRAAVDRTVAMQSADQRAVTVLGVVPGSGGLRWRLRIAGSEAEYAPREIAERMGRAFEPVEWTEAQPAQAPAPNAAGWRIPASLPVGALVTFSTARGADEALRAADFRAVVLRRLDEKRLVTRAECSHAAALRILAQLGFTQADGSDAGAGGGAGHAGL